jgi:hypothetical protein
VVLLLACIREILGFIFGRDTDYLTEGFGGFSQFLQENAGLIPKIRPRPLTSTLPFFDAIQIELLAAQSNKL